MNLSYTIPKAEENIKAGIKVHTFRTDRSNRWKAGMIIHHCYSFRSKGGYKCFHKNVCTSVQSILIVLSYKKDSGENISVNIDRRSLKPMEIVRLAENDGFENVTDFVNWFFKIHPKSGKRSNTMWAGKIIHWADLKY